MFDDHAIGNSRFSWSPDVSLGWIDGRGLSHYDDYRYGDTRYSTRDQIWLAAGGARIHYGDPGDWYRSLFFSFQPALHTGRTLALSSPYGIGAARWAGRTAAFEACRSATYPLRRPCNIATNRGVKPWRLAAGVGFDL